MEGFKLPDRFAKKEAERLAEKQRKKEEKADVTGGVDKFVLEFEEKQKSVLNSLKDAESNSVDTQNLQEHFDKVSSEVAHLQTIFSHFTCALPQFQLRKYQTAIFELEEKLQTLQKKLVPKKKFSFKNRNPEPSNSEGLVKVKEPAIDEIDSTVTSPKFIFANECGFADKQNASLTLQSSDVFQKDVSLSNLDKCTVQVHGSPSTVHITNVKNCVILIGPVSTSVFVDDCLDSDIVVACQQLRVHNTNSVNFYIHVTSRCIIEDSSNIKVAPYSWSYDSLGEDFKRSGLDFKSNNWSEIDDFNWLAKDKASPNWVVLCEDERKTFS